MDFHMLIVTAVMSSPHHRRDHPGEIRCLEKEVLREGLPISLVWADQAGA